MTLYDDLGVVPGASADELRRAYLRLARRYHPDVVASSDPRTRAEAERRMRSVNEAWRVLGDPVRRRAYDRTEAGADDGSTFRPFDTGDDPDPREAPDVPYRPDAGAATPARRVATIAPIAFFALSAVSLALALVLDIVALVAVAAVLFVAACVGFVVVPLVALARASRDEG